MNCLRFSACLFVCFYSGILRQGTGVCPSISLPKGINHFSDVCCTYTFPAIGRSFDFKSSSLSLFQKMYMKNKPIQVLSSRFFRVT